MIDRHVSISIKSVNVSHGDGTNKTEILIWGKPLKPVLFPVLCIHWHYHYYENKKPKMIQSFVFILNVFFLQQSARQHVWAVTRLYLHNGPICQQFSLTTTKKKYTFICILKNCLSTFSISLKLYVTNDTRNFPPKIHLTIFNIMRYHHHMGGTSRTIIIIVVICNAHI